MNETTFDIMTEVVEMLPHKPGVSGVTRRGANAVMFDCGGERYEVAVRWVGTSEAVERDAMLKRHDVRWQSEGELNA